MADEVYKKIANEIPGLPGVYRYYDLAGSILYVGKAKHLKRRIASYFNTSQKTTKTKELVKRIHRIEYTVVETEKDAFLLENNLIKELQPPYNISLKDDKTYPFVVIKNEAFPRVFISRRKVTDGSRHYGPFISILQATEILRFIKQTFPLRSCSLDLSERSLRRKKYNVCLEYHLGNCKGPCAGLQSQAEYDEGIATLTGLLKGQIQPLLQELKQEVQELSDTWKFEEAAVIQKKISALENYRSKSAVANIRSGTLDVFALEKGKHQTYVHYLATHEGNVIHTQTLLLNDPTDQHEDDLLLFAIGQLREEHQSSASEIIVASVLAYPDTSIKVTVPKAGEKKQLLDLAIKNLKHYKWNHEQRMRRDQMNQVKASDDMNEVLLVLQEELQLFELPVHIECFDNSNIQGAHPVAGMVCFKQGVPSKEDYRTFHIKTVSGIDDFASMKEVVGRRYKRLLEEESPLPQLVIIDGGKGQLNAALEAIESLGLTGRLTLVGLAKNKEELFFPGDKQSILLDWSNPCLNLIRRIRDEVHRFGLKFHRNKRSKASLENQLESIPGIGKATADKLLQTFRSVKKIRALTLEEISPIIGVSKAKLLMNAFINKEPRA